MPNGSVRIITPTLTSHMMRGGEMQDDQPGYV
jgi:hypothetical protein